MKKGLTAKSLHTPAGGVQSILNPLFGGKIAGNPSISAGNANYTFTHLHIYTFTTSIFSFPLGDVLKNVLIIIYYNN
jgi:hypothetical protein